MKRNRTARQHNFALVPKSDIPRSRFPIRQTRKHGFNASELVPIFVVETLPGDVWQPTESIAARLATPIAPVIDDLDIETFYFHVPIRIIDPNWEDFITGNDTDLLVPMVQPVNTGVDARIIEGGVFDHMGLPPQLYTLDAYEVCVHPIWAYFTIYNQWFRDQNLQSEWEWPDPWTGNSDTIKQDGVPWNQECLRANKRHDYFTSSLPWPQKGQAVTLSLTGSAPVKTNATNLVTGAQEPLKMLAIDGSAMGAGLVLASSAITPGDVMSLSGVSGSLDEKLYPSNLYADMTNVQMTTINTIRMGVAMQQLLERDARGGTRYVENLMAHWGVRAQDFRLNIPEYIGGTRTPVTVNPIAQTAFGDTGQTAQGNLAAEMHASSSRQLFTYAAQEHGFIIGLCVARSTPTYQQGTARMWRRQTRADYYDPIFANLGEQAVATQEIYQPANNAPSNATWGYQERGAEYRYLPNIIAGPLRSTAALPMDWWHYAEEFGSEPALNEDFITDKTQETLARSLATGDEQWACQIIMDIAFSGTVARLMPAYGVPGLERF